METLDIILLACFIPALVLGVMKGFLEQVTSLVSIVAGAWLAFHFSAALTKTLAPSFEKVDEKILQIICFVIILLIVCILLKILGRVISKLISGLSLGWLNRLLGLFFSIFTTALILGLCINLFEGVNCKLNLVEASTLDGSTVYVAIRDFASKVFPFLKTLICNG